MIKVCFAANRDVEPPRWHMRQYAMPQPRGLAMPVPTIGTTATMFVREFHHTGRAR